MDFHQDEHHFIHLLQQVLESIRFD